MFEYIYSNDIPMDAIVVCEQLRDFYLEDKPEDKYKSWDYYEVQNGEYINDKGEQIPIMNKLIPAHNRFGFAFDKKLFE